MADAFEPGDVVYTEHNGVYRVILNHKPCGCCYLTLNTATGQVVDKAKRYLQRDGVAVDANLETFAIPCGKEQYERLEDNKQEA